MQRHPIGQEEQLGRDRVHPFVLVQPEHRQPELAPRRDRRDAARLRAQPRERRRAQRMVRGQAEQAQRHVAERGHEDVGPALAVHAPAALPRARHLVLLDDARARVVGDRVEPADDLLHHHPLRQEHRVPHHLAFPVPGRVLELGEELVCLGERIDRRRRGLERALGRDHQPFALSRGCFIPRLAFFRVRSRRARRKTRTLRARRPRAASARSRARAGPSSCRRAARGAGCGSRPA